MTKKVNETKIKENTSDEKVEHEIDRPISAAPTVTRGFALFKTARTEPKAKLSRHV